MTPTDPALVAREGATPDWLKAGFWATFVFFICWGGAIAYWRTTGGNPAPGELFVYLLGLPATLLLIFFMGRKLLTRPATAASSATASTTPEKSAATPTQTLSLAILAAALRLSHGTSPEELVAAIVQNKARPDLDKELVDDDGFPVMTARSSDAVDEALQEEMMEWLALNGMAELDFSDEQWRAVTMASAVVAELAAQAAGVMSSPAHTQIKLQLIPIVPAGWNLTHRRATGMWLKQKAAQYGWSEDRIIVPDEGGRLEDETPSAVLKRLAHNAAIVNTPLLAMVVACASHIGDETVARWAADGSLFTSSQPQGQIPGEGAAGVLITNQASLADAATIALLGGIEEAQRDLSADETKRSDPKLLGELSERALKSSGASASNVGMLIADTGHRSSRALELMAHVAAHMPQLDEADAVVRVGVASGTCSDVPFITVLALAHHYVVEHEASVLCVSNEDPYRRVVVLMRPPIPLP